MTNSEPLKREAEQERSDKNLPSHWDCALWSFICAANPERKRWRKPDILWAKHHARILASAVASYGPKSLDERFLTTLDREEGTDRLRDFASDLGTVDEWRVSSRRISHVSSKLIGLMHSTHKDDALFPHMFETLGILAYVQARIAEALERAE